MAVNGTRILNLIAETGGSGTIEFVTTLPLLLAALVFSFDFGKGLWAYDVVARDVRAGLRLASRDATAPTSTCNTAATNLIVTGDPTTSADASRHFPWKGATPTFTCSVATYAAGFNQTVSVMTMRADVAVGFSFTGFFNSRTGGSLSPTYTLSVTDKARWIGN